MSVMAEKYTLKEPVELGKAIITELTIDRRVKAKYHRVISKPIPTEVSEDGTTQMMINPNAGQFDLMCAMTGQPMAVIDELGLDDYDYLRKAAEEMAGNFSDSLIQPASESSSVTLPSPSDKPST